MSIPQFVVNPLVFGVTFSGVTAFRAYYAANYCEKNHKLEERVKALANKMEVDKPISVVNWQEFSYYVHGNSLFGPATISVGESELPQFAAAEEFILAHEIAHIKNNDNLYSQIIATVVPIASAILFSYVVPATLAGALGVLTGLIALIAYSRFMEQRADLEAAMVVTNREKQGFIDVLQELKKRYLAYREQEGLSTISRLWRTLKIDCEGNNRFDILHPSISTRIRKIEETMVPAGSPSFA